jgi:hypothetical protein
MTNAHSRRQSSSTRLVHSTAAVVLGVLGHLVDASSFPVPAMVRDAVAQELAGNGGFEAGAAPWTGCGGVAIVDADDETSTAAMVRTGRHAAVVGGISDGSCGWFPASQFVLVQPVAIPPEATDLTLSFWFSRLGPELSPHGNTLADLSVSLSSDPLFGGSLFDVVSHNVLRGWTPFRGRLSAAEVAALRGQTAYLRFAVHYTADYAVEYFLDDVSLVAADVRTEAAPLPPALAGDGSRPLVLLQRNPASAEGLTVVRLDTDGTKPLAIDTGRYHAPRLPRWAPDGSRIAVVDDDVTPHDVSVPASLKARISRLSVMRPDGSARREVFATAGLQGTSGTPPFCIPPQCVDLPRPALDQVIKGVAWSPDGHAFALTVCARNRHHWGASDDDSCRVTVVDATSGAVVTAELDGWFRADWAANGRVLFNGPARYPDYEVRGVWEGDPTVAPPTQHLLLPASLDLLAGGDRLPTWAPDGRHFVTARRVSGLRYDANGFAIRNEAVVLHDRDDLANPRVLLIADRGGFSDAIDDFTWSPDGRYVLYALYETPSSANVWWLDVETGATGRVTEDGASVSVDWRQRADEEPGPGPEPEPAERASACDAAAIACVGKRQACLLKVHAQAEKRGRARDAAALERCGAAADACMAKAVAKQKVGKPTTLCSAAAAHLGLGTRVADFVALVAGTIDPGFPAAGFASACDAGKTSCVAQGVSCLLGAYAAAAKKGRAPDAGRIRRCADRLDGGAQGAPASCVGKLEAKQNAAKATTLCAAAGTAATLGSAVHTFVGDVARAISGASDE